MKMGQRVYTRHDASSKIAKQPDAIKKLFRREKTVNILVWGSLEESLKLI